MMKEISEVRPRLVFSLPPDSIRLSSNMRFSPYFRPYGNLDTDCLLFAPEIRASYERRPSKLPSEDPNPPYEPSKPVKRPSKPANSYKTSHNTQQITTPSGFYRALPGIATARLPLAIRQSW